MKDLKMRNLSGLAGFTVMRGAALVCVLSLVSMLGVIFWNAMPAMTWEFFTEAPRNMMSEGGIWPCIVGTFLLAAGALVIALPLGVMSAVFLNEYNLDSPVITVIRLSIANLAGVPSIIFGLFGLTFFVVFCGFGVSLLSGILTLAVLSLPIIINTTETALKQIPQDWREASLALGATRFETIMKVILPNALPGILTGAILALARAAGDRRRDVHGHGLLHPEGRRLALRARHGASLPRLRDGHFRHEHRGHPPPAVRHLARPRRARLPDEPRRHHPARTPPLPLRRMRPTLNRI